MNLILIGIMGCGKSTLGRMLAKRLKLHFVDMDTEIEKRHGTITDLFARIGEEGFRDIESDMARELAEQDGMVISTGGGIVKRPENLLALKRNGTVFFLDRPVEVILRTIAVDNRPLLKDNPEKLHEIRKERYALYQSQCDVHIDAGGSIKQTLSRVLFHWNRL